MVRLQYVLYQLLDFRAKRGQFVRKNRKRSPSTTLKSRLTSTQKGTNLDTFILLGARLFIPGTVCQLPVIIVPMLTPLLKVQRFKAMHPPKTSVYWKHPMVNSVVFSCKGKPLPINLA